jgi:hypothetical protein
MAVGCNGGVSRKRRDPDQVETALAARNAALPTAHISRGVEKFVNAARISAMVTFLKRPSG